MSQNQNNQQSPKDLITGIVSIIIAIVFVVLAFSSCNGDSSSSSSSSSSSGSRSKCAFKQNGRYVCSSPAKRGSNFCSYHQKYLDDAYNMFVGN
jgi:hypothetical protein